MPGIIIMMLMTMIMILILIFMMMIAKVMPLVSALGGHAWDYHDDDVVDDDNHYCDCDWCDFHNDDGEEDEYKGNAVSECLGRKSIWLFLVEAYCVTPFQLDEHSGFD